MAYLDLNSDLEFKRAGGSEVSILALDLLVRKSKIKNEAIVILQFDLRNAFNSVRLRSNVYTGIDSVHASPVQEHGSRAQNNSDEVTV